MKTLNPEIVEASVTGMFKTILILIGALVLLRFLGRVMIAKRNLDQERADLAREKAFVRERNEKLKNFGRVTVSRTKATPKGDVQDVDYEEVK
ncbi:hypothetical protein [Fluviicola sp.]|jgi:hypothetical protein|uniref:hypothetical protein n=1 Tax=Fluviicola sp. TaxID=1917219 RepID=UPI002833C04F|nr:hypothetical protein [Fluviicola sp.]MDR0803307.1 hypothetical protein [Fluviicola sp.]